MIPRGTTRTPGADPTRLPIGLDLRAISIAEGVRAGLAAALPVAASVWLHQPVLSLAALGALLTCIVDPGGPLRRRLPILLAFVAAGAALLGGFGLLRNAGILATLAVALPALFVTGFLRVWGAPAQALGNLMAVVLLLGTDEPLGWAGASLVAATFAGGGAWALLLTLALWRIHPFGPARRAVADVWDALAGMVGMLQRLAEAEVRGERSDAGWEAHARAGRGAVRAALERARATLMGTLEQRGPASGPAAQNLMRPGGRRPAVRHPDRPVGSARTGRARHPPGRHGPAAPPAPAVARDGAGYRARAGARPAALRTRHHPAGARRPGRRRPGARRARGRRTAARGHQADRSRAVPARQRQAGRCRHCVARAPGRTGRGQLEPLQRFAAACLAGGPGGDRGPGLHAAPPWPLHALADDHAGAGNAAVLRHHLAAHAGAGGRHAAGRGCGSRVVCPAARAAASGRAAARSGCAGAGRAPGQLWRVHRRLYAGGDPAGRTGAAAGGTRPASPWPAPDTPCWAG